MCAHAKSGGSALNPRHLSQPIAVILALSLPAALLAQLLHGTARFAELQQVHVTDSFWKPLLDRNRAVTIPHNLRMCREVGIVANFERVAGLRDGDYHGLPNWDEFLYKAIEAACYGLQQRPDPALEKELDDLIAVLAKAQDADGYLRTVIQMSERGRGPANLKRWSNLSDNLELYCAGHLFEAGVAHFQATGKRSLLDVALKKAELIDRLFGPGKRVDVCGHQEIEPALVRLYEATGDERWWKLAKFFVDTRGTEAGGRRKRGEFSQDHAPLFEQTEAVGQAPRATYFYSGAADVGRITGEAGYHTALRRRGGTGDEPDIWRSARAYAVCHWLCQCCPTEGLHVADGSILQHPIGLHPAVPSLRRFSPVLSDMYSCPLYFRAAQDHTMAACLAINLTEKESNITTSPVTFTS